MKRTVLYLLFALLLVSPAMQLQGQDLAHYKQIVKELSSAKYQGRGYAKNGANKAGRFLQKEYVICESWRGRGHPSAIHHRHQHILRQNEDVG